jgi:hypothetical protein
MRFAGLVLALAVLGCGTKAPARSKVEPGFDAFEARWAAEGERLMARAKAQGTEITEADLKGIREYPAIYVGPGGVIVGRKVVAPLAELESKREVIVAAAQENLAVVAAARVSPMVVFDLEDEPAAVVVTAMRMFGFAPITYEMVADGEHPSETLCAELAVRTVPPSDLEPTLTVTLKANAISVFVSQLNQVQALNDTGGGEPDFDKLQSVLKNHKESALFADRRDIEVGADGGTAGELLRVLWTTCTVGFIDVAVLPVIR